MKRSLEPTTFDQPSQRPMQFPPGGLYEPFNGMATKHNDDYAYRVTQIVPESPRGKESRSQKVSSRPSQGRRISGGKSKKRSRRASRRTVSDLSSDSGTEMDFHLRTRSGHPNQAFVHSRTPSSSLRYNELNARNLDHDIGIPLAPVDHLYARPLPRHSRPEIVVAGQGSFGRKPFQRHLRQSSHVKCHLNNEHLINFNVISFFNRSLPPRRALFKRLTQKSRGTGGLPQS